MAEEILLTLLSVGTALTFSSAISEMVWAVKNRIDVFLETLKEDGETEKDVGQLATVDAMVANHQGDWAWQHLKRILQITYGFGTDRAVRLFVMLSGILGAIVLILLSRKVGIFLSVTATFVSIILPYSLLRLKLQKLRVETSREGEILLSELYENYRINFFNMQKAIDVTADTIEDAPNSRRLLMNLSKALNLVGNAGHIDIALEEFKYSINTSWANILTVNMSFALTRGIDVSEAMADVCQMVTKARGLEEYERRENNESKLVLYYLAPICYILTVFGGILYFKLSVKEFLYNQFATSMGVTWLTISMLFYTVGIVAKGFLTRTSLDI